MVVLPPALHPTQHVEAEWERGAQPQQAARRHQASVPCLDQRLLALLE